MISDILSRLPGKYFLTKLAAQNAFWIWFLKSVPHRNFRLQLSAAYALYDSLSKPVLKTAAVKNTPFDAPAYAWNDFAQRIRYPFSRLPIVDRKSNRLYSAENR